MKPRQNFTVRLSLLFCLVFLTSFTTAVIASEDVAKPGLPKGKQTTLGLYVTSAEAYEKWSAAPGEVTILDVRTLEEYIYVGHATMAWNVPLLFQTHEWNAEKGYFAYQPNPDFISQVKEVAGPTDTIMVMCRSGGRSAMAVNLLAEAGFSNVYNISDGMEGDAIKDPESVFQGQRLKNGWKNSGAPWTYKIDPERVKLTNNKEMAEDEK